MGDGQTMGDEQIFHLTTSREELAVLFLGDSSSDSTIVTKDEISLPMSSKISRTWSFVVVVVLQRTAIKQSLHGHNLLKLLMSYSFECKIHKLTHTVVNWFPTCRPNCNIMKCKYLVFANDDFVNIQFLLMMILWPVQDEDPNSDSESSKIDNADKPETDVRGFSINNRLDPYNKYY